MGKQDSLPNYSPPRARWYSGVLSFGDALKRRLWFDRIRLPAGITFPMILISILVPGWGFRRLGGRLVAGLATAGCTILAMVFIACLGQGVGNMAFGLLLAAHTVSAYFMILPLILEARYLYRAMWMLTLLAMLLLGGYMPAFSYVQEHWLLPMSYKGRVFVIRRETVLKQMQPGEIVAFSIEGSGGAHEGVLIREGFGLGRVLGRGGDAMLFTSTNLLVNGIPLPREIDMPISGEWIVPEKHWFIWPEFDMRGGHLAPESLSGAIFQVADVSQNQLIGRPFKRWFFRRQSPL